MRLKVDLELPSGETVWAGRVEERGTGRAATPAFQYAPDFLTHPQGYPLAPSLPLLPGWFATQPGRLMVPGLADAQPDAWGRKILSADRNAHARREKTAPTRSTEVEVLAAVPDETRMGALRLRDESGTYVRADGSTPSIVELPELLRVVDAFIAGEDVDPEYERLLAAGTSVGGARPKATVQREDGTLAIAKFRREEDLANVIEWEAVGLQLARDAGIRVPHFDIVSVGGGAGGASISALVLDRFDRDRGRGGGNDGGLRRDARVGFLSAHGLLGLNEGEQVTYVDLAEALAPVSADSGDLEELYRRIALTLLVNNVDDHMRNHAFLRQGRGWRLSPAFDINPFRGRQSGTPVSYRDDPDDRDIRVLQDDSELFGVSKTRGAEIIGEVERATARWREVAVGYGVHPDALPSMSRAFDSANRERALQIATG